MNPFFFLESIASVSLSHDMGCTCTICKAAKGDKEALGQLMDALDQHEISEKQREFHATADKWTSPSGIKWSIHNAQACVDGHACAFHKPSDHPMNTWSLDMNPEKYLLVERICTHDIRHPDPDSVAYLAGCGHEATQLNQHDCDGCC